MNRKYLSVLAVCCAVGLTAITGPVNAGWFNKNKNDDQNDHVQLPVEPGPPDHANSNSKGYPNGRPWQAVEEDFDRVHRKLRVIDGKIDDINEDIEDLDTDLEDLADDVAGIADDVSILKNTLKVQVRVGAISESDDVSIDSSTVILYVQVILNGNGLTGLTADAFSYTNATPAADAASYCGNDTCFEEPAGSNGLYILNIEVTGGAGTYAATVSAGIEGDDVSIDTDDSNGASIVIFEIEESIPETT